MKIPFTGRVLLLGCGSVSRCLQPLLLRHLAIEPGRLTVMDLEDLRHLIPDTLAAGAVYEQREITPENLTAVLAGHVGAGDLLIDLAWNIDCNEIVGWCHDHGVLYLNTSVEVWDPYAGAEKQTPQDRTLYVRHQRLKQMAESWTTPGPTAVVEHGANPGLVSHWTKVALIDIATALLDEDLAPERRAALEAALAADDFPTLGMATGTKVIHISERDTQISDRPKEVGEFVNTWSVEGFREEGIAPAELGWGTHERSLPPFGYEHESGPRNQICIARMGISTYVRSWVPIGGPIIGMVVRHGEAYTISDRLTVWDGDTAVYRPTVHYAYLPTDAAMASLHELKMTGLEMQAAQRIMNDEIISGIDELGVLLLGHDLGGWWVGSQLGIDEARQLVPGQNATTLQVAASVLGAVAWMIAHPDRGVLVPDDLDHREVLAVADPYLGPCPSVRTDWTPLSGRTEPFDGFAGAVPGPEDVWQFSAFLVG
ncbi:MAG: saccharopine dehydrogenase NADP-binding domain-containing protein [Acidimicrobiales bacterium]